MWMLWILFLGLISVSAFCEDLDVSTIIQRSVEANKEDWQAAPLYDCYVREQEGKGTTKTYEEMMIVDSPYRRLTAINGKQLSPEDQTKQEQRLQEVIAQRQKESKQEREQRIARYERERKRDHLMMEQLTSAFDFKLLGKQKLNSHEVYLLQAAPRPGYQPTNRETEVLTGMQGKLWIDTQEFQWVKVEAEVVRPVQIEGFVARVEPGTRFELEKAPVAPGVWLVQHFAMKSRARILYFFTDKSQEDDTYFNCHRQP
jgi:hypothetical protein